MKLAWMLDPISNFQKLEKVANWKSPWIWVYSVWTGCTLVSSGLESLVILQFSHSLMTSEFMTTNMTKFGKKLVNSRGFFWQTRSLTRIWQNFKPSYYGKNMLFGKLSKVDLVFWLAHFIKANYKFSFCYCKH